jgi:hypothetical protein
MCSLQMAAQLCQCTRVMACAKVQLMKMVQGSSGCPMSLSLAAKRVMSPACTIQTVQLCSSAPLRGGLLGAQRNFCSVAASLEPLEQTSGLCGRCIHGGCTGCQRRQCVKDILCSPFHCAHSKIK